jgi:hypothetical protein
VARLAVTLPPSHRIPIICLTFFPESDILPIRKVVRKGSMLFELSPSKKQLPDNPNCQKAVLPEEVNDAKV